MPSKGGLIPHFTCLVYVLYCKYTTSQPAKIRISTKYQINNIKTVNSESFTKLSASILYQSYIRTENAAQTADYITTIAKPESYLWQNYQYHSVVYFQYTVTKTVLVFCVSYKNHYSGKSFLKL